jgi:hypothetical protein
MATVESVGAVPETVSQGGKSLVTPVINDNSGQVQIKVYLDKSVAGVNVSIAGEPLTFTTDADKIGVRGFVVGVLEQPALGVLEVAEGEASFLFTAKGSTPVREVVTAPGNLTLAGMSRKYGMTEDALAELNPVLRRKFYGSGRDLPEGTLVTVMV